MSGYTHEWFAGVMAANKQLKIARDSGPSRVPIPETATEIPSEPESPAKARKYRNEPTMVGERTFASKREAARYQELRMMECAGEIRDLVCQWRYPLEVNGVHVCFYVADFVYVTRDGRSVVEDCKGFRTQVYKLKAKLMFAVYGIKILET